LPNFAENKQIAMYKSKYKYNPELLRYDRIKSTVKNTIVKVFTFFTATLATVFLSYMLFSPFFDTPKERVLSHELNQLNSNYMLLNRKLAQLEIVLGDIQQRDNNIYRTVFQSEPIPQSMRQAGFGGTSISEGYSNSELMAEMSQRIDRITKQVQLQSRAYDELPEMARIQRETLLTRPAIQPVDNKNLNRTASGYGERIQPFSGTKFFHKGMDFTAPIGTKIYATGDGVVLERGVVPGFGNRIVIDHGYGYQTLYAHMDELSVVKGARVTRGQVIGTVGNTGISTGPHLHYEVHKNGKAVNPINYYYNDLTPEDYALILDLANVGKTFD
jgi:hypothetical protein